MNKSKCRYHLRKFTCCKCGRVTHEGLVSGIKETYTFTCRQCLNDDCRLKDHTHCSICGTKNTQKGYDVCWFCQNKIKEVIK